MKTKRFMRAIILSASLLGFCSAAAAQSSAVIAQAVDENGAIGSLIQNARTGVIGFSVELPEGFTFSKERVQAFRRTGLQLIRYGNGLRYINVVASYNASLTKATLGNALQSAIGENITDYRVLWNGNVLLPSGEKQKKRGVFHFRDIPPMSNHKISAINRGCRVPNLSGISVEITKAKVAYNSVTNVFEITANVTGKHVLSPEDRQRALNACKSTTPVRYKNVPDICSVNINDVYDPSEIPEIKERLAREGCAGGCNCTAGLRMRDPRDCEAYVDQLGSNSVQICPAKIGFTPEINGGIQTTNLSTYFSGSPLSDKVVPLMSETAKKERMCADEKTYEAKYFLKADQRFDPDLLKSGVFTAVLKPSSMVKGNEWTDRWDRLGCTSGIPVTVSLANPGIQIE